MRRVLPENVELTLKVLRVKRAAAGRRSISVVRTEDDKRLEDGGFLASRSRAEDGAIRRDFSPAEDAQAEVVRDLGEDGLLLLERDRVVRLEEDVTDGVLARVRELAADLALSLALEEEMGDAGHHTGAVAVAAVCAGGAAVGHGAEKLAGIGDDLVGLVALDMADEADTAGVLFELVHVQALACGQGCVPRRRVALDGVEAILRINFRCR